MRAAVRDRYGPPDVVSVRDVPDPVPGPDEVLVRVRASTVNRTDTAYREGTPLPLRPFYGFPRPRARILGCEFAGVVEAVGGAVTRWSSGDRVYGYDDATFGGHGELKAVRTIGWIEPIPEYLSFADAAALTEGPHYAWAFCERLGVSPGSDVLVLGATGAIGSAAVQLAAARGARVTAVCEGRHADLVRELGAARVIARDVVDFRSDGARFDAVVDAVGKSSFPACRRLLRPDGAYASTEPGIGAVNLLFAALPGVRARFPAPMPVEPTRVALRDLVVAGRLVPVVDRHYPLDDIVAAHRYVDSGRKVGSVVVDLT